MYNGSDKFTVAGSSGGSQFSADPPVPNGSYLGAYNVFMTHNTANAHGVECGLFDGSTVDGTGTEAIATPAGSPYVPRLSGAGVVTQTSTASPVKLRCFSSGAFDASNIRASLTPTNPLGDTTVSPNRMASSTARRHN